MPCPVWEIADLPFDASQTFESIATLDDLARLLKTPQAHIWTSVEAPHIAQN